MVEVARAKGSTPREAGAYMLVSRTATYGTIGGGQLEFMAIDHARQILADARGPRELMLDIPLGPEIGQCCGGRVEVLIRLVNDELKAELLRNADAEEERLPRIYLFGGGHVGHALAAAFALLPVRIAVVETRGEALEGMPAGVTTKLTPVPEEMVRAAPAGSAFVDSDPRPCTGFSDRRRGFEAARCRLCRHDRFEDQEGDVQELVPEIGRRKRGGFPPPRVVRSAATR